MLDTIIQTIRTTTSNGAHKIAVCAAAGVSCEGWLKVELLCALHEAFDDTAEVEVWPERERIDLTVSKNAERVLIELKTFPCNYGRSGKPITNFISGVIADLHKLRPLQSEQKTALAVWIAYSIPEQEPVSWRSHISRVEEAASRIHCSDRIHLWQGQFAHLYVMEPLKLTHRSVST